MAAQLKYSYDTPKGVPGGKVDISFDNVDTRTNEEADGVLKYGMAVQTGTYPGTTVKVPTSGATKSAIEGVALSLPNTEQDMQGNVVVRNGATIGVMRWGKVWGRLASDAVPVSGQTAYVVVDGEEAGSFTSASEAASVYVKCASTDSGAKEVVADDTASPTSDQIKVAAVTPVQNGYSPAVGDYVLSKQIHGATLDAGIVFGNQTDADNGIAIVEIR